ncbi:hypothetical protein [Chitinophaga pinensis]|uniref:Lipoprotein n=1 Tax=Chitinophaga pinensis (strain ATCC 43595 / DSM 2588 / LMG 13176 / NBRC 15968 / NCIMB 11800 / UQM 2034) TaxID=485918 RepID=A0A979G718_CHIPD|nr:hypothetical protein [Chitinophaga pinensis]ACU61961.1 hypothetical protein Cpin_4519 [Chitinophaga pinensis DSM 2588]
MSKYAIALLSLLLIAVIIVGCGGGDPPKGKNEPHQAKKKIVKINFFMETSGSMAGYLQGSTDFRKRIPNLLVNIEGKVDSGKLKLHNYYIADSIVPFSGSTQQFINAISTGHPTKSKSSEMHKIFEMIAQHTDSNDISIFVSDCILSYPDAVLRQKGNENINRDNAEGELKATMTKSFLDLKQHKHMCAMVYGFNSSFVGNYYTYQNKVIPIKGNVSRPYYMWVIGNRELLSHFNNQLNDLESLQPYTMAMDFGLFGEPVKGGNILFNYLREGDWAVGEDGLKDVSASAKKPCVFAIATDLSSLPAYAKDTTYLRQHLKKQADNLDYSIEKILLAKNIDIGKLKKSERAGVQKGTHVFVLRINNVYQSGNVTLHLPLQYDTSYRALSIMDDSKVTDIDGKTFALQHLIDGVREAYQNNNQDYIDISIPIKK